MNRKALASALPIAVVGLACAWACGNTGHDISGTLSILSATTLVGVKNDGPIVPTESEQEEMRRNPNWSPTRLQPSVAPGTACSGDSLSTGFADLTPGSQVVVKNEKGVIIASGVLAHGVWQTSRRAAGECRMAFAVLGVPTAAFYSIELGRRRPLTYSLQEMNELAWKPELTLGP